MRTWSLAVALVAGCAGIPTDVGTPGELGRVEFQYHSGNGFSVGGDFHPALDRAMMVGTTEILGVGLGWQRLPALSALTDNPDVIAVVDQRVQCMCAGTVLQACTAATQCPSDELYRNYAFTVEARGSGSTVLSLRDSNGQVYDRTTVSAEAAASLELQQLFRTDDYGGVEARAVTSVDVDMYGASGNNGGFGAEAPLWLRARDADGRYLVASFGVDTVVDDANVASASFLVGQPTASSFDLVPHQVGETTLVLTVPRESADRLALRLPVVVH